MAGNEVCQLLRKRGFDELIVETFEKNKIDMNVLKDIDADDMKELGITALGDRKRLQDLIDSIQPQKTPICSIEPAMSCNPKFTRSLPYYPAHSTTSSPLNDYNSLECSQVQDIEQDDYSLDCNESLSDSLSSTNKHQSNLLVHSYNSLQMNNMYMHHMTCMHLCKTIRLLCRMITPKSEM